jgi:hypothetical protein
MAPARDLRVQVGKGLALSGLNPGGSRKRIGRIFGATNIAKACERNKVPEVDKPNGSIADRPHQNSREIERRLKRQRRKPSA